ncbi:MAG: prohead core protein [Plesiomonas sp.]
MSLKQKLLEAAKRIDATVELDSIFESAEVSADVKTKMQTVFESAVKARAIALAESHITEIAEKSEELVEARVQEELAELNTTIDTYMDHVANKWLEENTVATSNNIKVEMFESLMGGLKEMFVEHNVVVPAEAVDVVAEMEAEVAESRQELSAALTEKADLEKVISNMKRDAMVESAIANLTESQKETVQNLIEGIDFSDAFEGKLTAIVEMTAAKAVVESADVKAEDATVIVEADEANANFVEEEKQIDESTKVDPSMAAYLAAL